MRYRVFVALLLAAASVSDTALAQQPNDVAKSFATMQILVDATRHTHAVWRAAIRSAFREAGFRRTPPVHFTGKRTTTNSAFDARRPVILYLDCNGVHTGTKQPPRSPERPATECSQTARAAELVALLTARSMRQTESDSRTLQPHRDAWRI